MLGAQMPDDSGEPHESAPSLEKQHTGRMGVAGYGHASTLLARVKQSEIELVSVVKIARQLARHFQLEALVDDADDIDEAVAVLKAMLERGVKESLWTVEDLTPSKDGIAAAKATVVSLVVLASAAAVSQGKDDTVEHGGSSLQLAGDLLDAVNANNAHQASGKYAAERSASAERLKRVSSNPDAAKALEELASFSQGTASDQEKVAYYAKVVEQHSVIAELLKASHVENPKGKESVVLAGARCAGYWRDARNGLHTAAEGLLKSSLPLDADGSVLAVSAFNGNMLDDSGVNVKALGVVAKAKVWLGSGAKSQGVKADEVRAESLLTLLTALNPIGRALTVMMPQDRSIEDVWGQIVAEICKVLRRATPQVAVDQMLVPVFKSYARAWDDFQKTPSKAMPSLAEIWQRERDELVKSITTSGASATGDTVEVKVLKDQQAEMSKQMSALKKLVYKQNEDDTRSHDGDGSEAAAKKRAKNKSKRQAANAALKEKKQRDAGESGDEAASK